MCLVVFAWQSHPRYSLVLAGNRDEFYSRPTQPAGFWEGDGSILAGRDLQAGGTWLGVSRSGRFATVTNYRDPASFRSDAKSRGQLVLDYLQGSLDPLEYLKSLEENFDFYNGFSLLAGNPKQLAYASHKTHEIRLLGPGIYGLSNSTLDVPWPKVKKAKRNLESILRKPDFTAGELFSLLDDRDPVPKSQLSELPDTGVGAEREELLSPIFIHSPAYGTRASTLLLLDQPEGGTLQFFERTFTGGVSGATNHFEIQL